MGDRKISIIKDDQLYLKEYSEVKNSNQEVFKSSNTSNGNWWVNDDEEEKVDARKRWSFGSDTSEPVERLQNRLCCSPVDFDSPASSENEELIVNSLDDSDETFKKYITACPKVSPSCSPTFKKVNYCSDKKKSNKNHDVDLADDELIDYSKIYVTDKDYAETDLDQPTDYSLRYPDEEDKKDSQFYCTNLPDDTVKTYHTEGTPNNFSNATSMTDLLSLEDSKENYETNYKCQFSKEQRSNKIEKSGKDFKKVLKIKNIPQDSKPVTVLKESNEIKNEKAQRKIEKIPSSPQSPAETCDQIKVETLKSDETYAQETPLMFSRCSSLDSLNEFDQHSIHDDQCSVISDFSHRTSGAVSPSDLPDSPTQTVPPSPTKLKQPSNTIQKTPSNFSRREFSTINHQKVEGKIQGVKHFTRVPDTNNKENRDFFEDTLVTFEKESMISMNRAHSTTGSVLSSLTIDDDEGSIYNSDNRDIIDRIAAIRVRTSAAGMHQAPTPQKPVLQSNKVSVQHNKALSSKPSGRSCEALLPLPGRDSVDFGIVEDNKNKDSGLIKYQSTPKDQWYETNCSVKNLPNCNDSLRVYCTEDTPTLVSPFSSQSNLSALSVLSISDEEDESNDEEPAHLRRIDVSPFDSQINLANFSLLCIEEENEEEEEEAENQEEKTNYETDYDSCADFSEAERKVFEECVHSGVSKLARRNF